MNQGPTPIARGRGSNDQLACDHLACDQPDHDRRGQAKPAHQQTGRRAILVGGMLSALSFVPNVGRAQTDSSSTLHAGTVVIEDPVERQLFGQLLCQCGDCARLPLDTCDCSWADEARTDLRRQMEAGAEPLDLVARFRAQYGPAAISIPSDEGFDRMLWAIPLGLFAMAAVGVVVIGRRWKQTGIDQPEAAAQDSSTDYDEQLDEELRRLERD